MSECRDCGVNLRNAQRAHRTFRQCRKCEQRASHREKERRRRYDQKRLRHEKTLKAGGTIPVEEMEWLDGPGLVKWFEETGIIRPATWPGDKDSINIGARWLRRMYSWRQGDQASIYTVDEFLIERGHHICEIPEHLYRLRKIGRRQAPVTQEKKREAVKLVLAGEETKVVAEKYGVVPRTVRHWVVSA